MNSSLRLALCLVAVGIVLALFAVPYAWVVVLLGAVAFVIWIFGYEITRL